MCLSSVFSVTLSWNDYKIITISRHPKAEDREVEVEVVASELSRGFQFLCLRNSIYMPYAWDLERNNVSAHSQSAYQSTCRNGGRSMRYRAGSFTRMVLFEISLVIKMTEYARLLSEPHYVAEILRGHRSSFQSPP